MLTLLQRPGELSDFCAERRDRRGFRSASQRIASKSYDDEFIRLSLAPAAVLTIFHKFGDKCLQIKV